MAEVINIPGLDNEKYLVKITAYDIDNLGIGKEVMDSWDDLIKKVDESGSTDINSEGEYSSIDQLSETSSNILKRTVELMIDRDSAVISTDAAGTFYFPLPNSLSDQYVQSYEVQSMNLLGSAISKASSYAGQTSIKNISEQALKRSGIQLDPNILSIYRSSNPRNIDMSWNIIPKSRKQYDAYVAQISKLKNWTKAKRNPITLGSVGNIIPMNFLIMKYIFCIEIISLQNDKTPLVSNLLSASRDITEGFFISLINTNIGSRQLMLRHDGNPTEFSLSIQFVERKPLWRDDWEKKINSLYNDQGKSETSLKEDDIYKE
ncbi:hypothetical protein F356_081 [Campylobacter phage F356]|uniref:Uncharacterized protein n=2 Tax=Fletchervirus CPX TaxID=1110702 RepID=A0A7T3KEN6_9CAUD|nr:hypothetical protein F355_115 [Campylobacter phage F355]QPX63719.1 hypothetical protein F356_081 [Campylobacter phage F356]QQV87953.1 hypothetical protein [Campylobacter phage CJLB-7]